MKCICFRNAVGELEVKFAPIEQKNLHRSDSRDIHFLFMPPDGCMEVLKFQES